jgi:hypothetical protein
MTRKSHAIQDTVARGAALVPDHLLDVQADAGEHNEEENIKDERMIFH